MDPYQAPHSSKLLWLSVVIILATALPTPLISPTQTDLSMPHFVDIAPALGIDNSRDMYGPNWADYNGDGRLDLLLTNHLYDPLDLFQQQSSGQLVNVAGSLGFVRTGDFHAAAWGDCDNDGRLDLYLTIGVDHGTGSDPKRLYHQLSNGIFVDIASQAGVADPLGRARAISWADYDKDGDLDLFLANAPRADDVVSLDKLFRNNGNCTFTRVRVGSLTNGNHGNGASWGDYDNDGDLDVFVASSSGSQLHRNNGGSFTNVTASAKIISELITGIAWGDYDNDGDLDLFLARARAPGSTKTMPGPNRLYRNNGNGTFTRVETAAGVNRNLNSHHAVWTDFDNDGDLDLYVANSGLLSTGNQPNFLYMNNGDGTFQEVAGQVGATGRTDVGLSGGRSHRRP